jgi:hypothetical protein
MTTHSCVVCAALPIDQQPKKPRPAHLYGRKRLKRCTTHERAERSAAKAARHATYVTTTYGLSAKEQAELWEFQGRKCPCGRKPTRMPDTDHDHRCCPGPKSCGKCVRGLLCRNCNTYVIGRYSAMQLRALADYLDNPSMRRMRYGSQRISSVGAN